MPEYTFGITACFGKGDYGDSSIDFDLTDDEYAVITRASECCLDFDDLMEAKNNEELVNMLQDEDDPWEYTLKDPDALDINGLYERVYDAAVEQEQENTLEFDEEEFIDRAKEADAFKFRNNREMMLDIIENSLSIQEWIEENNEDLEEDGEELINPKEMDNEELCELIKDGMDSDELMEYVNDDFKIDDYVDVNVHI